MTRRLLPYALRLLIVLIALSNLAPTPPRIVVEPPQTVQSSHPIVCVHTRLTDEVEDWKIQRTLQMVREMGASTIVDFFPWAYVETAPGYFDWHHPDRIIRLAREQGLTVIARLGLVPAWARPPERDQQTSLNSLTSDHYADYARFVGAFAAHFRGQVQMIIAWNEPNLSFEWGYRAVSPAEYTDFLRQVYQAAHAANPDIIVLGGALAPTLEGPGSSNALSDLDFLRGMYTAGAAPYFDGLAAHTYGFTFPPSTAPAPDQLNFRRIELLHTIMAANGDAQKPVYITESGWNDHPRWAYAVRPGERVTYTLDSFKLAESNWPWAKNLCVWYFRAPVMQSTYRDYFALVTPEFRPLPIYDALRQYARGLNP